MSTGTPFVPRLPIPNTTAERRIFVLVTGIRMDVVRGRPSLLSKRSRFRPSKHECETVVRGSRPLGAGSAPLTPFNPSLRVNSRSPWTVTHWTTVTHSRSSWSLLIILQSIFYGIRSVRERTMNIPSYVTVFLRADVEILRIPQNEN